MNVRYGSEAEVGSCSALAAVSTSDMVRVDRHRRSTEPAPAILHHALGSVASCELKQSIPEDRHSKKFLIGCRSDVPAGIALPLAQDGAWFKA